METVSPLPLDRVLLSTTDEAKPDIYAGSIQSSSSLQTPDSISVLKYRLPDSSILTAASRVQPYNPAYPFEGYQSQLRVLVDQNRQKLELSRVKLESVEVGRCLSSIEPTASYSITARDSAARWFANSRYSLRLHDRNGAAQQLEQEPLRHPLPEHQIFNKALSAALPLLKAPRAHHMTLVHPKSPHVRKKSSRPTLGRNSNIKFRLRKRTRPFQPPETSKPT